jgi:exocyst complex component 3
VQKKNQIPGISITMGDAGTADGGLAPQIADLLRTPEDLEKIPALKLEFSRKKGDIDARLREGLKEHLESTQSGMSTLAEGQKLVGQIKEEMRSIADLCEQAQAIRHDFPQIDYLARVHRNFEATKAMQSGLATFNDDVAEVERLLVNDEKDLENQPNLLEAHMRLTRLRDFRDEAIYQIGRAKDMSLQQTLEEWFQSLEPVVDLFDDHVGQTCMNLINLVQADNPGIIVRLAIVIAAEEKNDERVKALRDARKDHQDLVDKFTSFTISPKTERGYKEKFLGCIEAYCKVQFEQTRESFMDEPSKLGKQLKWFFNDLFVCRQGMQKLFPKKWKIFKTYVDIYHRLMHDFLISFVDSDDLRPANMLAIVHYIDEYYKKMKKLGVPMSDLIPHVLDSREGDLVREWRNLITSTLSEWMVRMYKTDKNLFLSRADNALDQDANGHFRTKTLGDMWRMLREQIMSAGGSEREDVVEGVVSAMFTALKTRQQQWEKLVNDEVIKFRNPTPELSDGLQLLQDWLVAIANDQIACIDDADADAGDPGAQLGYVTRFKNDITPLVSSKFLTTVATTELDSLRDGYVDLATHCIHRFVSLIFLVDFKSTIADFFVPGKWYEQMAMKRICSTFEDYMTDYSAALHPTLVDIFLEEMSDALVVQYLTSIRTNKGVKFRRQDPFPQKFRDDVVAAFEFFGKYPETFEMAIKPQWRPVDFAVQLLEADKANVPVIYEQFKGQFWDLQLSWVEGVLKTRDEWDRSMISAVKAKAAGVYVERGMETIMGKVK